MTTHRFERVRRTFSGYLRSRGNKIPPLKVGDTVCADSSRSACVTLRNGSAYVRLDYGHEYRNGEHIRGWRLAEPPSGREAWLAHYEPEEPVRAVRLVGYDGRWIAMTVRAMLPIEQEAEAVCAEANQGVWRCRWHKGLLRCSGALNPEQAQLVVVDSVEALREFFVSGASPW